MQKVNPESFLELDSFDKHNHNNIAYFLYKKIQIYRTIATTL